MVATPLKPSLVTLCLPPALSGQAIAKFSISLSPSHGQHPLEPVRICPLAGCLLHSNATLPGQGAGTSLSAVSSVPGPEKAHDRCVLSGQDISCLWENCFPWSPPGQGPGGSGPTFAPGASMLHATECGTNSGTCRLGRVTPGHVPCNPGRALGRARSMFLSFALEPLQLWLEPPLPGLSTPGDGHALALTQVRAPVFTPEPLLLSVCWALPPPLCHL